jgi:[NiFe] hydrogenase diaphorase moiety small subunit
MSDKVTFTIDGVEVTAEPGQTILQAAALAGVYIPHLCAMKGISPHGSCRVCLVNVNGRPQAACIQPAVPGAVVENDTEQLQAIRKQLVEMLFVEGNHFCMFCEKSGNCELQALAYRLGIMAPRYPYLFPKREVDASHPDVIIDHNRCILCARCQRSSLELDQKAVYGFVGRGEHKRMTVSSKTGLGGTDASAADEAVAACPVGALMKKRVGYAKPVGQRLYDNQPIGSDIEAGRSAETK